MCARGHTHIHVHIKFLSKYSLESTSAVNYSANSSPEINPDTVVPVSNIVHVLLSFLLDSEYFRRRQNSIANHLPTWATASRALSDRRLTGGGKGSHREWLPDRPVDWLRQAHELAGVHRHRSGSSSAPYVLSGMSCQRKELDALYRAQNRRDDRDWSRDGSGQGDAGYLRLRGYLKGAQRWRGAQVPTGNWSASRQNQEEVYAVPHDLPYDYHACRRHHGDPADLFAADCLQWVAQDNSHSFNVWSDE